MGLCEIPLSPRQARKQDSFDTPPIIQQFKENRNGRFQQKRFYQRSSRCGDFINHGRQLSFCIDGPGKDKDCLLYTSRLRKAAQILAEEDISISMVMDRVGIDNASYFSRIFKKEFGESPSEFVFRHHKKSD